MTSRPLVSRGREGPVYLGRLGVRRGRAAAPRGQPDQADVAHRRRALALGRAAARRGRVRARHGHPETTTTTSGGGGSGGEAQVGGDQGRRVGRLGEAVREPGRDDGLELVRRRRCRRLDRLGMVEQGRLVGVEPGRRQADRVGQSATAVGSGFSRVGLVVVVMGGWVG